MKKRKNWLTLLCTKIMGFGSIHPVSQRFGSDRGLPVDRYYIEKFLSENQHFIKGTILEVGDRRYTHKFGGEKVTQSLLLNKTSNKKNIDIVGNLETGEGIPESVADCFILTQTLLCIFNVQQAAANAIKALKPGGILLITVPGIVQISRNDYEQWGQYWSFTDQSVRRLFDPLVPPANISVKTYGNVKAAAALLYGLSVQELRQKELEYEDKNYQLIIAAAVKRPE